MMTLKEYKKTLRYAVGYSASLATLKRVARTSKVKHVPARSKLRIAKRARSQYKRLTFASRYGARPASPKRVTREANSALIQFAADLSKLEGRVLSNMQIELLDYLAKTSS